MRKLAKLGFVLLLLSLSACQSAPEAGAVESVANAELRNTLWKLTELKGNSVQTAQARRMASLTLTSEQSQARIVTACNQGSARYEVNGNSIKFDVAMSTKMMCESAQMQQEKAFFKVIQDAVRYEIKGETLALYDAGDQKLATFQSEYLK